MPPAERPLLICRRSEKLIDIPARKTNSGKTVSYTVRPSHARCPICSRIICHAALSGYIGARRYTTASSPMINSMSSPRSASIDTILPLFCAFLFNFSSIPAILAPISSFFKEEKSEKANKIRKVLKKSLPSLRICDNFSPTKHLRQKKRRIVQKNVKQ